MEIITINAEYIRSGDASVAATAHRRTLMEQSKRQWCSNTVYAEPDFSAEMDAVTLGHSNYWAALYMRESNPTLFKLRTNGWDIDTKEQLQKMFARIEVMIHSGRITGDVIFYRSQAPRITTSKYPLCNNGVYAIFTGNPEWILGDNSRWRSHTGELDVEYERFRNNFTVYDKIFNFSLSNLSQQPRRNGAPDVIIRVRGAQAEQEHLNMRTAYLWCMLTDERPVSWNAILESCTVPQRAGLMLWKEGKIRLWWHHSHDVVEPQHQITEWGHLPWPAPRTFGSSGLDIDDSGRFIEAND